MMKNENFEKKINYYLEFSDNKVSKNAFVIPLLEEVIQQQQQLDNTKIEQKYLTITFLVKFFKFL